MKIIIYGKEIICDRAVRTQISLSIIGGEHDGMEFSGISNWSGYELLEGAWSQPAQDPRDLAVAELMRAVATLKGGASSV